MVLKSQIDYVCPQCAREWLPYASGLLCPQCGRAVPDAEVTGIIGEALESAKFNKRLYGHYDLEYWLARRLGDRYLEWGFKALQLAESQPDATAEQLALATLMDIDLEDAAPLREHIMGFLAALIAAFREARGKAPQDWEKMPEPEKPFFGRKIIDDTQN